MIERREVLRNIHNLAPKLYSFTMSLTGQERLARELVSECFAVMSLQSKGRALGIKSHEQLDPSHLFKKSLSFLGRLLEKRSFALNSQESAFYHLSYFQRFLLLLKYRLQFSVEEISKVLDRPLSLIEDELYQGRHHLEQMGQMQMEERC